MATDEMNGANKLAERILADARADADTTAAQAAENVQRIAAESEKKLAAYRAEFEAKRKSAVTSVMDGCRTRASLDSRKSALTKKRVVIDDVFEKAYAAALTLPESARSAIFLHLLKSESEGGETVVPAKADRAAIQHVLESIPECKLPLAKEDAPIDGGFLLVGNGYEKDCSFRSVLSGLRDAAESDVAKLLFN